MSSIRKLRTDVAIVGGGIVGSSAALALRRMGVGVVLLERDLCGSRSSGVNYGGVRRQGRPVSQLPLAQRAHRIWGNLAGMKSKGIPVEYAPPKEGAVVLMVGQCVIANNTEPELSQKLAEFLLSPLAQANVLQYGAQIPTNPKAPVVGDGVAQVADINKWMKTAVTIDWESINANRPAWNARWNKTIEK